MESENEEIIGHIHSAWCLLVSTMVLGFTAMVTSSLRSLIKSKMKDCLLSWCLLDFLCGVEQCMCGLELGVVLDIYDIPVYCVYLWTVIVWQGLSWSGCSPSPASHLVTWRSGGQSLLWCLLRSATGLSGALVSHSVISQLWMYDLSHYHDNRELVTSSGHCMDELQVSLPVGLLVEGVGALTGLIIELWLLDIPRLVTNPLLGLSLNSAVAVMLVMLGFDLTGGYYSPSLALGLKMGCGQGGMGQHILLYTIAPCLGALLASPLYQESRKYFYFIHQEGKVAKKDL